MTQQSLFDCNIVAYFVSKESRLPFSDEKRGKTLLELSLDPSIKKLLQK